MLNAIDRWVSASANLPTPRRAAALFVADQLLTATGGPDWAANDTPPIRRRLEADGASFIWDEIGATYAYTHTWLKETRRLDPDGRAGDLAYLALMEMGFETSGKCTDQGGEGFRAVVREGDAYLRGHPRSPIAPEVHLLMAAAYSDIVALANGLGSAGRTGDSDTFRSLMPRALMRLHNFTSPLTRSPNRRVRHACGQPRGVCSRKYLQRGRTSTAFTTDPSRDLRVFVAYFVNSEL